MVKVSDFIRKSSKFLNIDMVKDGDILEFVDEGEIVPAEKSPFGKDTFRIRVKLPDGTIKIWTLNKITIRNLMDAYGDDSKNWVNKKVRVKKTLISTRMGTRRILIGEPYISNEDKVTREINDIINTLRELGMEDANIDMVRKMLRIRGVNGDPYELLKKAGYRVEGEKVILK